MKSKRTIISILLALLMVLGAFPALVLPASAQEYDIWVFGTKVTDANCNDILGNGVFSYDPEYLTLYIHGDYTASGSAGIVIKRTGVTVSVPRDSSLTKSSGSMFEIYQNVTFTTEGRLDIEVTSQSAGCGFALYGKSLTFREADLNIDAYYGIDGSYGGNSASSKVYFENTDLLITYDAAGIINCKGGIFLTDTELIGSTIGNGQTNPSWNGQHYDNFEKTKYDLWVANTRVTKTNKSDVLGDGTFTFEGDTLRIKKAYSGNVLVNSRIRNFKIVFEKSGTFTLSQAGLILYGDTEITCENGAVVTINVTNNVAISVRGGVQRYAPELTIRDASLTLKGSSRAVCGDGKGEALTIKDSSVTAKANSGSPAIYGFNGGVTLDDCYVCTPHYAKLVNGEYRTAENGTASTVRVARYGEGVDYEISIRDIPVTDLNAYDVLGDRVFRYDYDTKTLTISGNNVSPLEDYNPACVVSSVEGLTVYIATDSTISQQEGVCLYFSGDTVIKGPGKLTLVTSIQSEVFGEVIDLEDCTLTFDEMDVSMTGRYGVVGTDDMNSRVEFVSSNVEFTTPRAAIYDCEGGYYLDNCEFVTPDKVQTDNDGTMVYSTYEDGTDIIRTYYPLWVSGTHVTGRDRLDILGDGVFSFDGKKTLTVKGNYDGYAGISSEIEDLTICFTTGTTFVSEQPCIVANGDVTVITYSDTTMTSTNNYAIVGRFSHTLTFRYTSLTIHGKSGAIHGKENGLTLVIDNAHVIAVADNGGAAIDGLFDEVTLYRSSLLDPLNGTYDSGTVCDAGGTPASRVEYIREGDEEQYDLWICGTMVTELNRADVLGDGAFEYDPCDNILYVYKNASVTGSNVIMNEISGLQIWVVCDAVLTSNVEVLRVMSDTTITGSGTLTLNSGSLPTSTVFVENGAKLRFVRANVVINSQTSGMYADGTGEKLYFYRANVEINSYRQAFANFTGGVTLTHTEIVSPAGAEIIGGAAYKDDIPVGSLVLASDPSPCDVATIVGDGSGNWLDGEYWNYESTMNSMARVDTDNGDVLFEIGMYDIVPGEYEFVFVFDHQHIPSLGTATPAAVGGRYAIADCAGNVHLTVTNELPALIFRLDLTNYNPQTGEGAFFYTYAEGLTGDLDGDGEVTVTDVTTLLNQLAKGPDDVEVYDINGDGEVDVNDVTALLNMIASAGGSGAVTESYETGRQQFYEVTGVLLPLLENVEADEFPYTPGGKGYCFDLVGGTGLSHATFDTLKAFLDAQLSTWSCGVSEDGPYTNVNYTSDAGWIGLTWDSENVAVYVNASMN